MQEGYVIFKGSVTQMRFTLCGMIVNRKALNGNSWIFARPSTSEVSSHAPKVGSALPIGSLLFMGKYPVISIQGLSVIGKDRTAMQCQWTVVKNYNFYHFH